MKEGYVRSKARASHESRDCSHVSRSQQQKYVSIRGKHLKILSGLHLKILDARSFGGRKHSKGKIPSLVNRNVSLQ